MTTITKLGTIQWGQDIRVISKEVAEFFYSSSGWVALGDAQAWAKKNKGRVESAHGILEQRTRKQLNDPSWQQFMVNYEEDFGVDAEGRFGEKGKAVILAIQGGGIMLSSPQRLQEAYTSRTPKGEPSLRQEEISQALAGMLPNGQQIRIYTLNQLMKEDPAKLPQTYAIVAPLQELEETPLCPVAVGKLPNNKIFVMRAGHQTTARNYAKALKREGVGEYGNYFYQLANADPENPSGRVLLVGHSYSGGLVDCLNFSHSYDVCFFVGVRRVEGAEGAAPPLDLERTVKLLQGLVEPARIPQLTERLTRAGYR